MNMPYMAIWSLSLYLLSSQQHSTWDARTTDTRLGWHHRYYPLVCTSIKQEKAEKNMEKKKYILSICFHLPVRLKALIRSYQGKKYFSLQTDLRTLFNQKHGKHCIPWIISGHVLDPYTAIPKFYYRKQ